MLDRVSGHVEPHLPESCPRLSRLSTPFPLPTLPRLRGRVGRGNEKDADARDKRGHDGGEAIRSHQNARCAWMPFAKADHPGRTYPSLPCPACGEVIGWGISR